MDACYEFAAGGWYHCFSFTEYDEWYLNLEHTFLHISIETNMYAKCEFE